MKTMFGRKNAQRVCGLVLAAALCLISLAGASCAATAAPAAPSGTPNYVWWEGEDFAETNVPEPLQAYPGDITPEERSKLSGGTWLVPRGPEAGGPYQVSWKVEVPEDGTWNLWVRKFWKHGPFKWRLDDRQWETCGRDIALHDGTYLRRFIGANWVFLGRIRLERGSHELNVQMIEPGGGGCIDCFCLIAGPFVPRGKLKPGEESGKSRPGYFAWEPAADPLLDTCPIDLRELNEETAGGDGFVRRKEGGFVLGGGEPVRFWMVQGSGLMNMKPAMMDYWARRLSKYGVNLVRLGMLGLFNNWKGGNELAFDERLDRLHYLVSALKKEGIYVYLGHLYWHTHVKISAEDGFPAYGEGKTPLELLFFDEDMQEFYKAWVDALLNTENPYTGAPLSREPAVAFVEIQNESSTLFWTFKPANFVPETRRLIERRFGTWCAQKYGSIRKALDAWGPGVPPESVSGTGGDHPEEGRLALYNAGYLTNQDWAMDARNPRRAADQLQFLVESQRGFYEQMIRDWREELGVQNMIACSNWKTADPRTLGVLEHYTYLAGDVICRNSYYGVNYDPRPERFHAVDVGDTYVDRSALKPPAIPGPLTVAHVENHPYMITENNWTRPNRFRVEWPFLIATYAPMMGVDGWNFFALDTPLWQSRMDVWDINVPSILGQFPAAALAYRRGDVEEAPPAVTEKLALQGLYNFKEAALFELSGNDVLWESKIGEREGGTDQAEMRVDRLAFFTGKVNRDITPDTGALQTADLEAHIDHGRQNVRALTDQLRWDYGTGVVTVDTPRAQGACGFLKEAGPIPLSGITIDSENEYGSVLVISLDGEPIADSDRLLVQTGTEDWPYGFATQQIGEKERITAVGGYPLNVRRVHATVTLKNADDADALVLDENGYATGREASVEATDAGLRIALPKDSLYTLVEK